MTKRVNCKHANKSQINEKRVDELISVINLYTTELENYDRANFTKCMNCIGFVGAIIAAVGAILCTASNNQNSFFLNEAVSIIILLIPAIITLYLYNFSMSCRRSALFRGYLQFLDCRLNEELNNNDMQYNYVVIPKYLSNFWVNKYGSTAMILFLLMIFSLSFVISYIFALKSISLSFIRIYKGMVFLLIVLCIVCDGACVVSLTQNDKIIENVKKSCEENMDINYLNKHTILHIKTYDKKSKGHIKK